MTEYLLFVWLMVPVGNIAGYAGHAPNSPPTVAVLADRQACERALKAIARPSQHTHYFAGLCVPRATDASHKAGGDK